jgi:hypothetical protein
MKYCIFFALQFILLSGELFFQCRFYFFVLYEILSGETFFLRSCTSERRTEPERHLAKIGLLVRVSVRFRESMKMFCRDAYVLHEHIP